MVAMGPTGFERFYKRYLRHVGLQEAKKAWEKLHPDIFLEKEIMDGLEWYITHEWANRPIDKVPHPATWLNQRRWEDAKGGPPQPLSAVAEGRPNFLSGVPKWERDSPEGTANGLQFLREWLKTFPEKHDLNKRERLRLQSQLRRTPF